MTARDFPTLVEGILRDFPGLPEPTRETLAKYASEARKLPPELVGSDYWALAHDLIERESNPELLTLWIGREDSRES